MTDTTSNFGLGLRNEQEDRLVEFCQREDMLITYIFYQLPPCRLYPWKAPSDGKSGKIKNQIDYIMIRRRFRNTIKSVKTYPGADIASDHNPVVAAIHVKLVWKTTKERMNPRRLKENIVYKNVDATKDQQWQNIKRVLKDVGKAEL